MLKFAILLFILNLCCGYKVLLVFPIPGGSHLILGEGYVRHLVNAGHEVYFFLYRCPTVIINKSGTVLIDKFEEESSWIPARVIAGKSLTAMVPALNTSNSTKTIRRGEVVGTCEEIAWVTYVTSRPIKNAPKNLRQIDISENIKYYSKEIFNIKSIMNKDVNLQSQQLLMQVKDNFWIKTFETEAMQKFLNDSKEKYDVVIAEWLYTELSGGVNNAKQNEDFKYIYEPILTKRGQRVPHYDEVRYNASLMLGNSDITTGDGIALPQNYKHIGGYHIKDVVEPLPKDLEEIMDEAEHGVIYFSMGSKLKSAHIPNSIKKELLQVFSELKQTVIWKLEETIPNLPKNVHIVPWAPQTSILAHPNILLFITHGGLLSTLETLRFGVPIIGIPFFADQYLNVNRAVAKGFGKRLDFDENAPKSLRIAVREILEDSRYHQRAKELSKAFNHRMVPPGKELVHWVEHVVKTGGAPHLRSAALHVSWYKKLYLDLISIILLTIIGLIMVLRYILNTFSASITLNKRKIL